jgi:hypothetical protein
MPKFASRRGDLSANFGIRKGTGNSMIPVPL